MKEIAASVSSAFSNERGGVGVSGTAVALLLINGWKRRADMDATAISNVLWFAGIGGLFYLMMRGGGCGGHRHGGSGGHQHGHDGARPNASRSSTEASSERTQAGTAPAVIDPVCGMPVQSIKPELQRSYGAHTFSFCSQDCMRKFDADPAKYAGGERGADTHRHSHAC